MKNRVRGLTGIILAALLCFALPALGQNTSMYFNGGYQGDVWCGGSEGCVATGFYDGSINNVNVGPGQPGGPGMICDDYNHNVSSGDHWTANGIDAANLNPGNIGQTLFGNTIGLGGYTELAYLVNMMFTGNPSSAQQSAISQALWYITGGVSWSQISTGAQNLYTTAANLLAGGKISLSQYANLWIYTPSPNNGPQEMWGMVQVPEGGSALIYLLLAGTTCFGAMRFRRRMNTAR